MMVDHTLNVEPVMVVLTPYALSRSSHHLFNMGSLYVGEGDAFLIRLYVLCAGIELGLKAAILGDDCTEDNKQLLKTFGHDLLKLCQQFSTVHDAALLDDSDIQALMKINPYFRHKGLEYFTVPVLASALSAHKEMPEIEAIRTVAGKVDAFLAGNGYFIDAKTSQPPAGGILNFV